MSWPPDVLGALKRGVLMPHREPLQHVLRGPRFWGWVLALAGVTYWLSHTPPVLTASNVMSDNKEVDEVRQEEPFIAPNVTVVRITADDYREIFAATSPLDPNQLAGLVALLLHHNPHRLVVDIDTSERQFEPLPRLVAFLWHCLDRNGGCTPEDVSLFRSGTAFTGGVAGQAQREPGDHTLDLANKLQQVGQTVIWARSAGAFKDTNDTTLRSWIARNPSTVLRWIHSATIGTRDIFTVDKVLGQVDSPGVRSAVAMLRPDEDGRLRHLRPFFTTAVPTHRCIESIAVMAMPTDGVTCDARGDWDEDEELQLRFLPYLRGLTYRSAGEFMAKPGSLAGRTVFLGGTYSVADSFYMSDGREYAGVEVLAAASLALGQKDIVHHLSLSWEIGLKLFLGFIVALINHFLRPGAALTLVGLIMAVLVTETLSYGLALALNLAGFLVAIGIEQSVESALDAGRHLRKLEHELDAHASAAP